MTREERRKIMLLNGQLFDFAAPDFTGLTIEHVAEALSKIARFTGNTPNVFYSVAEHSVYVSRMLEGNQVKKQALLHDGPEMFFSDTPGPIKRDFPEFRSAEHGLGVPFMQHFCDYDSALDDMVDHIDKELLTVEQFILFSPDQILTLQKEHGWTPPPPDLAATYTYYDAIPVGLEWRAAYKLFMDEWNSLDNG